MYLPSLAAAIITLLAALGIDLYHAVHDGLTEAEYEAINRYCIDGGCFE